MKVLFKKYLKLLLVALIVVFSILMVLFISQKILDRSIESRATNQPLQDVATIFNDLPYCNTTDASQTLDLLIPKKQTYDKYPLLVYIHGGGWSQGDKDNSITAEYASQLASVGLAAASIDYRLSVEAVYPAQNNDVSCAVNFLIGQAAEYNFDISKIILFGDSAGGQLAAMEAIAQHHEYLGVIMAYGVSDLSKQISQEHDTNALNYLGTKATEVAKNDSPAFAKSFPDTSFLLVHGTGDSVVPAQESKDFANILSSNGVDVEYVPVPNAPHAFLGSGDSSDEIARKAMLDFIGRLLQ